MSANDRQAGGDHYKRMGVQPWNVVDTWPLEQQIGFYRGNLLKYTMRLDDKDERLINAEKSAHYAEKLVEVLKRHSVAPAPWAVPLEAPSQDAAYAAYAAYAEAIGAA